MQRDQVKWLIIEIAGALCVLSSIGGAMFFTYNRALSFGAELDSGSDPADGNDGDKAAPEKKDAPKAWHEWAAQAKVASEAKKPEYERVKALYDRISAHREIRRRLFHEADFEYAEAELPALFAKISDPLAADQYSKAIDDLGELSFDTEPEDLRKTMKSWTDAHPDSHYAWLVRGVLATSYAWYWRGNGVASTVTNEGWTHFDAAIQEARQYLEKSYQLEPGDPESSTHLITVCMAQSRPRSEVELHFNRATKVVPSHWLAYNNKFEFLKPKWSGSWPEYEEELRALKPKTGDTSNPMFLVVYTGLHDDMEYEQNGQRDKEAQARYITQWLDIWKTCVERWPDDPTLHGRYLVMLNSAKRYDEEWEQYQWLGNRYPMQISFDLVTYHRNRISRLVQHAGKLSSEERRREFDRIIALDPQFSETYHDIGVSCVQRGEYEEATGALLKALELDPSEGSTYYVLALSYEKLGRFDDALRVVQDGKDTNPREAVAKGLADVEKRLLDRVGDSFKPIETPSSPR